MRLLYGTYDVTVIPFTSYKYSISLFIRPRYITPNINILTYVFLIVYLPTLSSHHSYIGIRNSLSFLSFSEPIKE